MIRFYDLFGGIGGFRLGLERTNGFKCVGYCDSDKYAVKVYNKNFGENHEPTDVRKLDADKLPDFDLLVGGFPCQPFSIAGRRKGFNEDRGTLFHEIIRIAEAKGKPNLLLENVKGLLSAQDGNAFKYIIAQLSELGFCVEWQVLDSRHFGVPQHRERVFIHCFRGESGKTIFPITEGNSGFKAEVGREKQFRSAVTRTLKATYARRPTDVIINQHFLRTGWRGDGVFADVVPTLETGSGRDLVLNGVRKLTPIECERLQSFPDDWTAGVSDSQRYKLLGNAVTVNVIEFLGRRLAP